MTFEKAIQHCYGIAFRGIPADGRMRHFLIGKKDGFSMLFAGAGIFGCWQDNQAYEWSGDLLPVLPITLGKQGRPALKGKALLHQQNIVAMGNHAQDCGKPLTGEDEQKYLDALVRVIEAKNG